MAFYNQLIGKSYTFPDTDNRYGFQKQVENFTGENFS